MSSVSYVTGNKTKVYKCNKNIRFIYHEENLPLSDSELLQINQFWNEQEKKNKELFNGKVLTANQILSEKAT